LYFLNIVVAIYFLIPVERFDWLITLR